MTKLKEIRVILPLPRPVKLEILECHDRFIEKVSKEFGGITYVDSYGLWYDAEIKQMVSEEGRIYTIASPENKFDILESYAVMCACEMGEKCLYITDIDGNVNFIEL